MRIVIDTNVWISALISREIRNRLTAIIGQPDLEIIGTESLMEELREVVGRPKFQKYASEIQILDFLKIIFERLDIISPQSLVSICRDPNDDFLLALCKDANADFLITGDNDLLALDPFENTRILNLSEFEQLSG